MPAASYSLVSANFWAAGPGQAWLGAAQAHLAADKCRASDRGFFVAASAGVGELGQDHGRAGCADLAATGRLLYRKLGVAQVGIIDRFDISFRLS